MISSNLIAGALRRLGAFARLDCALLIRGQGGRTSEGSDCPGGVPHSLKREATFALLDALRTYPLDAETADQAGEMIRAWRKKGVTISGPDAVIAVSALRCQATLVTPNPKHFPMAELTVLGADEEGHLVSS